MEDNPPPYNPQLPLFPQNPAPTAPFLQQVTTDTNSSIYPSLYPTCLSHTGDFCTADELNEVSESSISQSPPKYTPTATTPLQQMVPANAPTNPPLQQVTQPITPLRCKSGTIEVGVGNITDEGQFSSWKSQFIEVRDGMLIISPAKNKPNQMTTISLKDRFVFMPGKRLVAVQGGCHTLVLKASSEVRAHQWLMTLSQYCFVAPMMEGFCDKLSRGKKIFEERFLRLTSDGILSWFKTDNEDSERRGAIQLRGERCVLDGTIPSIVHVQVEPKGYQFRFNTPREAQLWLIAFQWHYGRKPLCKASVPIRNKVK